MTSGPEFRVDVAAEPPVLRVAGEVDIESSARFGQAAQALATKVPRGPLVLDLVGVRFMDSSGLSVMVNLVREGREVVLRNPPNVVRTAIAASGLDEVLVIEP